MKNSFLRRLLSPVIFIITLVIIFEEWLWIRLTRLTAWIAQLWLIQKLEILIRELPPWAALIALFAPSLTILPFKVLAIYFMVHNQVGLGIISILTAKVIGTALVARIFVLTKEKVLTIKWFFYVYTKINSIISWAWNWLKAQPLYNQVRSAITALKLKIKDFLHPQQ